MKKHIKTKIKKWGIKSDSFTSTSVTYACNWYGALLNHLAYYKIDYEITEKSIKPQTIEVRFISPAKYQVNDIYAIFEIFEIVENNEKEYQI